MRAYECLRDFKVISKVIMVLVVATISVSAFASRAADGEHQRRCVQSSPVALNLMRMTEQIMASIAQRTAPAAAAESQITQDDAKVESKAVIESGSDSYFESCIGNLVDKQDMVARFVVAIRDLRARPSDARIEKKLVDGCVEPEREALEQFVAYLIDVEVAFSFIDEAILEKAALHVVDTKTIEPERAGRLRLLSDQRSVSSSSVSTT
jgi:hypothetical protein